MASTAASTAASGTSTDRSPIVAGQRLATFGADDDLDVEAAGRGQEVRGPVGLGGQEEEYAAHLSRMARHD